MLFSLFILFTALIISGIAAFYSIMGLTAIFAAAFWPIVFMGSALEVGKIVSALWLHKYWQRSKIVFKLYLIPAVVVLMLITSMGIFGFLSKAHLQQTARSDESSAQILRITTELERQQNLIERAEKQITKLETTGSGSDAQVQSQIDKEQKRIDSAYARVQPAIDEQNKIIAAQGGIYVTELTKLDNDLARLQKHIDAGEVKKAQAMVGASADGKFGRRTAEKFRSWQSEKQTERVAILKKIEQSTNNPQAKAAALEVKRIRQKVETEISESNKLINRLRLSIGKTTNAGDMQKLIDDQHARIKSSNTEVETLTKQKYTLQAEYRKLEAEVGPVRYVAALIYGDNPDKNLLERAVRWVIVALVFVFDPLAVVLILAAAQGFVWAREDEPGKKFFGGNTTPPPEPKIDPDDLKELYDLEQEVHEIHEELKATLAEKDELQRQINDVIGGMTEKHSGAITDYQLRMDRLSELLKKLEVEKASFIKSLKQKTNELSTHEEQNKVLTDQVGALNKHILELEAENASKKNEPVVETPIIAKLEPAIEFTEEQKIEKQKKLEHKFRINTDTEYELRRSTTYLKKDQVLGK